MDGRYPITAAAGWALSGLEKSLKIAMERKAGTIASSVGNIQIGGYPRWSHDPRKQS